MSQGSNAKQPPKYPIPGQPASNQTPGTNPNYQQQQNLPPNVSNTGPRQMTQSPFPPANAGQAPANVYPQPAVQNTSAPGQFQAQTYTPGAAATNTVNQTPMTRPAQPMAPSDQNAFGFTATPKHEKYNTEYLVTHMNKNRKLHQVFIVIGIVAAVLGVILWLSLMPESKAPPIPENGKDPAAVKATGQTPAAASKTDTNQ